MSDDATKKDSDSGLVLEWTDALDTWELDLDESATAESSPLPHAAAETPLVPAPANDQEIPLPARRIPPPPPAIAFQSSSRPSGAAERPRMYQPPSPAEVAKLERSLQKTSPPPTPLADTRPSAFGVHADEQYTEIATIPPDMLEAISTVESSEPVATTKEPAALAPQIDTLRPFVPAGVESSPTPPALVPIEQALRDSEHDLASDAAHTADASPAQLDEPVTDVLSAPLDEPVTDVLSAPLDELLADVLSAPLDEPVTDVLSAPLDELLADVLSAPLDELLAGVSTAPPDDSSGHNAPRSGSEALASAADEDDEDGGRQTLPGSAGARPEGADGVADTDSLASLGEALTHGDDFPDGASVAAGDPPLRDSGEMVRPDSELRDSGEVLPGEGEQLSRDGSLNSRLPAHATFDSAPAGRDDSAPAGRDDSAPAGRDDSAPAGRDDSAPAGRDELASEPANHAKTPIVAAGSTPSLEVVLESAEVELDPARAPDGHDHAEPKRRIQVLEALASRQTDQQAAELLVSAGELAEQTGDLARAEVLYERALAEAPKRAPALRALTRLAFRAGDHVRYLQRLERLSELPLSRLERTRLLTSLSLARWVIERDAPAALGAATEAQRLSPEQLAPSLLLARIESATHPAGIDATIMPLVQRTQDLGLAASWLVTAGRAVEARGDISGARALYARAAGDDPFAFDAQLSLSRTNHALGAHAEAARALLRTLESFDIGPVAEAVRRRAAHMLGVQGAHAEAVELLEHASDDVSLRTAAQIALAGPDHALKLRAVEAWTLGADGPERALALLTKAELLGDQGDSEGAESALELAALADPSQSLVAVLREALARRSGNAARLAEIVAGEEAGRGALAAAAKVASSDRNANEELNWLTEAAHEESGVSAHWLAIDASAELGRADETRRLLRAEGERGAAQARALALLALAELERQHGDETQRRDALQQAWELAPRDASVLRAFARAHASAPETLGEAAHAYRREAENTELARSAFAYLREGFASPEGSAARLDAFVCAAGAAPSYGPANWALHREARRQGDLPRLSELHAAEAERAVDPRGRAAHLVRAALIRAGEDTDAAALQLTRALALMPDDPVLAELVLRLGDAAPAATRIATLDRLATRVREPFRRQLVLAAAATLEDEGQLAEAAERYRAVLHDHPQDAIADAGLERVVVEANRGSELLEAKRRAVLDASTERARARALEELLLLETDSARALELAHELLALAPSHPLALRALERDAMERDDRPALSSLQLRLVDSGRGGRDKAARLRFVHLLRALEPEDDVALAELDRKVLQCANDAPSSLWLSRQLMSAAIALNESDLVVRAIDLLAEQAHDPVERVSLAVQKGWLTLDRQPGLLEEHLREVQRGYPDHPTALELIAEARRAVLDLRGAAEQFEQAGEQALSDERSAHLWTRAAEIWDKQLKMPERAQRALQRAAAKDLDFPGVRERLSELLTAHGDVAGLVALTTARIAKGGTPEQLVELLRKLAELHEQRGDRTSARSALREALAHAPDSLPVWRDLARAAERAENHPERVEALGAVIRLSRDPLELRDALLELGAIHEQHIEDAVRAEAAYQRVLKLGPRNTVALERLAALYRRGGAHDLAAEALQQLARAATDPRQKRDVTLQLASWKEEQGDARAAEDLLETLRRAHPTDHELLRSLAGLLRRTNAHVALAMHLNRAVNDLRHALMTHFDDTELWRAVLDMLVERGRLDVAGQCAATALALGVHAPEFAKEERTESERQGIGAAAVSELLDDLVFPDSSPPSLRIMFRHAAEALNKTTPLDLRTLGAEKLDKRHPLRNIVAEQARWIAHRDIEVFVSAELPYAFVPIQESPVQLLVGRALIDTLTPDEQRFLVARALKIARSQMSIACRLGPQQLELLLHGLVRSQVPSHAPNFLELSALDDAARRVAKQLSRRAQSELVPHLLELTYAGIPRFDAANVYGVASVAGSRAGLLATSDIESALSALIKLSGLSLESATRAAAVAQVEEARELVSFAISEGYFEARMRAGKEAR